jgi:hypothetical protein
MPLAIDSVNNAFYTTTPVVPNNNLLTNATQATNTTSLADRLQASNEAAEARRQQLQEQRDLQAQQAQQRQVDLQQAQQQQIQDLQDQLAQAQLNAFNQQQDDLNNPFSAENIARQQLAASTNSDALGLNAQSQVTTLVATQAITTYQETQNGVDLLNPGLVA